MVYNIFIDADIILDVLLKREEFYRESYEMFLLCEREKIKMYTSSSIILNVQYIGGKISDKKSCATTIKYLVEYFIDVINPSRKIILEAYSSNFTDVEVAVQYYTAKDSGIIDFLITRNTKDYKHVLKSLSALTPGQFLKQHIR